ncbi:MAG: Tat pathway signal protein [Acidobacteriaceae bacterium]|nr:Tat pathway signal protein [Acidobacteriaceae bacterium]MBV9780940.1 Tat pathway signal protein [Acidobacteriaceae bacterium]
MTGLTGARLFGAKLGPATEGSLVNRTNSQAVDVAGHTLLCEFRLEGVDWKVYEDLQNRDGNLTFVSARGETRVLTKSAEPAFAEANPPYLGLNLSEIGMSGHDLLADKLLENGDPNPEQVGSAAPPIGSNTEPGARPAWNTFVGTKECFDTMPVYPAGNTRTYHPVQYFPELMARSRGGKHFDGLIGGWMPAVRKLVPISDTEHIEILVFGDVEARDKFIVQTWHRTARIQNGKITKVVYGYSYPAYPPARQDPQADQFYRALLVFANYWEMQLSDFAPAFLPDKAWLDMSKHAFAKELMVRPGGVYPKYGAVDRDYYGPEYDGFQDIFTMAVYANLEWGRFEQARQIIDNYFSDFVNSAGMVNMRGPETAQFGLELSLLARYWNYTRDSSLLLKHRAKISATARLLAQMHDESLRLPKDNPGHGLIHGWNESDSCLMPTPSTWWQPYFANSAFAARGFEDIGRAWQDLEHIRPDSTMQREAGEWRKRSKALRDATVESVRSNVRADLQPPYVGPLPGMKLTFRESMARERPSPQQWPHRAYSELLQADVLPPNLANTVIDCMRAYGAITLGVVANVEPPHPEGRDILGFISYGYAQALLRLDRIEEYLLFVYSHRYHDHTRGSWTAAEVASITGDTALFCIPAQQTIPLLVRWMLVSEDSDQDRLYFARGLPREWTVSGKEIQIKQASTRWGRVSFRMQANPARNHITANIELPTGNAPKELYVKLRVPSRNNLRNVAVNGRPAALGGVHVDTVSITVENERQFEVTAQLS